MNRVVVIFLLSIGCASQPKPPVSDQSVVSGTAVSAKGKEIALYKTGSIKVGDKISEVVKNFPLSLDGKVALINVVPSIDTPVCEEQTHILGETLSIDQSIKRISISRDLPMAQKRFAKEAKLENIEYVSDYKNGDFGKATGLLMKDSELLARAVIVTDAAGVVRYLQIVPDITTLPDMSKAIAVANDLARTSRQ